MYKAFLFPTTTLSKKMKAFIGCRNPNALGQFSTNHPMCLPLQSRWEKPEGMKNAALYSPGNPLLPVEELKQ